MFQIEFSGKDVFVVSVTDSGANGEGGKSDFIEIIVNVNQVDDAGLSVFPFFQ